MVGVNRSRIAPLLLLPIVLVSLPAFAQQGAAIERGLQAGTGVGVEQVLIQSTDFAGEWVVRNWQNRMGVGGEGYLASPAVVAASVLLGYMAPPTELDIPWNPDRYGL